MTVMKSGISWTDSSWNPVTGCTKVSPGCQHCYAETLTQRFGRQSFGDIVLHPSRLRQVTQFKPLMKDGVLVPRLVFVNSMSDAFHERIPDEFRDQIFDAIESNSSAIFQLLTKRPGVAQRYLRRRYGGHGALPAHIWLGVSIENNAVRKRIDVLRAIASRHAVSCAFLSVEPLIAPIDACEFNGMAWVLIGGESGLRCRPMEMSWLEEAVTKSRSAGAAIWFKQYGHIRNNPDVVRIPRDERLSLSAAFDIAVERGLEHLPSEKGGATLRGRTFRELPRTFEVAKEALRAEQHRSLR